MMLMFQKLPLFPSSRLILKTFRAAVIQKHELQSDIIVEWSSCMLCIEEVIGSILSTEVGCPDSFPWFSSVLPYKCWDSNSK
jgi:hypothetical protein